MCGAYNSLRSKRFRPREFFEKVGTREKNFFSCFRSNFGAITRLETLAVQATLKMAFFSLRFEQKEYHKELRLDEPVLNGQLVFRLV